MADMFSRYYLARFLFVGYLKCEVCAKRTQSVEQSETGILESQTKKYFDQSARIPFDMNAPVLAEIRITF